MFRRPNYIECKVLGAQVTLVDGLISDCARIVDGAQRSGRLVRHEHAEGAFRIEGKKTMGYEVAEQFGWNLPDAILYPTGGGVGPDRNVESVR